MLEALLRELDLQRDYLEGAELNSIYLGGGTPSLLEIGELNQLFDKISKLHKIHPNAEITLEANPDDLSAEKLSDLKNYSPVNRLSIGIQSFFESDLKWMNRAHNTLQAHTCLENSLKAGFNNLTIDLIFGAPTTSDEQWAENLRIAFQYDIPHLSCYGLTVEEGTALGHFVNKGKQAPPDELQASRQFGYLMDASELAGYVQYEISNYAKAGHQAVHNSNYWKGVPYLGVGPSAHSYNGKSRQWNLANNALYIKSLETNKLPFETETLTPEQTYNEYVMTGLRTIWGVSEEKLLHMGAHFLRHFEQSIRPFMHSDEVLQEAGTYRLTKAGRYIADRVASDCFID